MVSMFVAILNLDFIDFHFLTPFFSFLFSFCGLMVFFCVWVPFYFGCCKSIRGFWFVVTWFSSMLTHNYISMLSTDSHMRSNVHSKNGYFHCPPHIMKFDVLLYTFMFTLFTVHCSCNYFHEFFWIVHILAY